MAYTAEDDAAMGRIADAGLVDSVAELAKMLGDPDLVAGLMIMEKPRTDPGFEHRLGLLIHSLRYVLDAAESTQLRIKHAKA